MYLFSQPFTDTIIGCFVLAIDDTPINGWQELCKTFNNTRKQSGFSTERGVYFTGARWNILQFKGDDGSFWPSDRSQMLPLNLCKNGTNALLFLLSNYG